MDPTDDREEDSSPAEEDGEKRVTTTRAVDRALQLLTLLLLDGEKQTLSSLAKSAGLSPSTALRLLTTLVAHDYATQTADGLYQFGSRIKQLAARALRADPLYEVSQPHLEALASESHETACLGILAGDDDVVYLQQVNSSANRVQTVNWIGRTIPRRGTALGAALDGDVGSRGYAVSKREGSDVTAVAAPVRGGSGVIGALSINAPSYRITAADTVRFGKLLVRHAHEVSVLLGGGDPLPPGD